MSQDGPWNKDRIRATRRSLEAVADALRAVPNRDYRECPDDWRALQRAAQDVADQVASGRGAASMAEA